MTTLARFLHAAARGLALPRDERITAFAAWRLTRVAQRELGARGLRGAEVALRGRATFARDARVTPERTAELARAAARFVPAATCLARSLALLRLLDDTAPAAHAQLCIGVRKREDPPRSSASSTSTTEQEDVPLDAHAWVELGGLALNDDDDVRARYAVVHVRAWGAPVNDGASDIGSEAA